MGVIEIDLHGHTWSEAIQEFTRVYNNTVETTSDLESLRIVVIHGYGSSGEGGIIRRRLRAFLKRFPECVEFIPGEETMGNQGCTEVKPLGKLPSSHDILEEQIEEFCEHLRTKNAIARKFRRYGDPQVSNAIRTLGQQGRLCRTRKNNHLAYKTC